MNRPTETARIDVPEIGDGSVALQVAAWHVAEGQRVRAGQAFISLRLGRATIKLPSPHSGKVVTLYVNPLDTVVVGSALAEIELESAAMASHAALAAQQRGPAVGRGEEREMSSNNRDRLDAGASAASRAAPAVRSLAKKLGVDLEKCVGTGRDGTITMNDVIARTNQAGRANKARPAQSQPVQMPSVPSQPANQLGQNQPSRSGSTEPVSSPPPAAPVVRPVNAPVPNRSRGWMSELEAPAAAQPNQPSAPTPIARPQPRTPVSAQSWATMEDELPVEQSEPRIVASRLQDLSSDDFPSAERQPTEPQEAPSDPYAPRTNWFATAETTTEETVAYQESVTQAQPAPAPVQPPQALNPWGAVEVEEQPDETNIEQAEYDPAYATEATSLEATEEERVEEFVELVGDEPAVMEPQQPATETTESDWETALTEEASAESDLAVDEPVNDLTQFEVESLDTAVMTTAYEAPASQVAARSELAAESDWSKSATLGPETPAEWAQPELSAYANTASAGLDAREVPLRTPYLDMTPRTLIDQEDRLHGQRRNMALNMTRARDEVATCTMFDDADLNAWPNFSHITVRLLRAIVAGIRVEPGFNATFDPAGPSRRLLRQINVAVSVDTREGLTVPVLRDIGSRSLEDLREYVYHMKERTLSRSLSPEDLRDFSFSLANYGIFAGRYATPLVVPPTVATLGCGRLERGVVAGESVPEIHAMLPLSLTFDHRCVTMGEACRFLAALKQDLELPE